MSITDIIITVFYVCGVLATYSILRMPPYTDAPSEVLWTSLFSAVWPLYWIMIICMVLFDKKKPNLSIFLLLALLFITSSCHQCHTPRVGEPFFPDEYGKVRLVGRMGNDTRIYYVGCSRILTREVMVKPDGTVQGWIDL